MREIPLAVSFRFESVDAAESAGRTRAGQAYGRVHDDRLQLWLPTSKDRARLLRAVDREFSAPFAPLVTLGPGAEKRALLESVGVVVGAEECLKANNVGLGDCCGASRESGVLKRGVVPELKSIPRVPFVEVGWRYCVRITKVPWLSPVVSELMPVCSEEELDEWRVVGGECRESILSSRCLHWVSGAGGLGRLVTTYGEFVAESERPVEAVVLESKAFGVLGKQDRHP